MNMEQELTKFLQKDTLYQEANKLAGNNSSGNRWLIGGYLFRRLSNILYGTGNPNDGDIDILVNKLNKNITADGWDLQINRYGNPKFLKGDISVDLIPLNNVLHIKRSKAEPSIESFISCVPLTVQAIVYDIQNEKLFGDVGIQAIETRTVGVNNLDSLRSAARKKSMTLDEYINKYTKSLGFERV